MTAVAATAPHSRWANPIQQLLRDAPGLPRAGLMLGLLVIPLLLAQWIDTRMFQGVNVWIKPLKRSKARKCTHPASAVPGVSKSSITLVRLSKPPSAVVQCTRIKAR